MNRECPWSTDSTKRKILTPTLFFSLAGEWRRRVWISSDGEGGTGTGTLPWRSTTSGGAPMPSADSRIA